MASYEQVVPCTWIPALQEPRFSVLIHPLKFRRPLCDVWVDVFALKYLWIGMYDDNERKMV